MREKRKGDNEKKKTNMKLKEEKGGRKRRLFSPLLPQKQAPASEAVLSILDEEPSEIMY